MRNRYYYLGSADRIVKSALCVLLSILLLTGIAPAMAVFAEEGVASIGDVQYQTLQDAIDAASNGDTITVLKDISENVSTERGNKELVLTIDLGGNTITPADPSLSIISIEDGRDVTVKNGKIVGYQGGDDSLAALQTYAYTMKVDNIEFNGNSGGALAAFYAVIMDGNNQYETKEIKVNNCKFYYNGSRDGERIRHAVEIDGYSSYFDNCSFYGNDRSLKLFTMTPDNDTEVNYSIRNTRFSHNEGMVIDAAVTSSGGMNMYNVYINDNDVSGDEAVAYFHGPKVGEGGTTSLDWCKIYNNQGAQHTILSDTPSSLSLYGTLVENNTAENTGAICAKDGYVFVQQYAVVRNNSATGSGDRATGGIALYTVHSTSIGRDGDSTSSGGGVVFNMYGGALYDNKSENAEFTDTDLFTTPGCLLNINVEPNAFEGYPSFNPVDKDFDGYKWIEQKEDIAEDLPNMSSDSVRIYKIGIPPEDSDPIYIDGQNGSDDNDGSREAPVKTFDRAKELLLERNNCNRIVILGKITVKDDEEWSLPEGAKLIRDKDYKGICVEVASDAKLALKDISIDGGSKQGARDCNSLINVKGELDVLDGTVLENNSIGASGSKATIIDVSGTANIKGGTIRGGNIATSSAAAVVLNRGATVNMTGGSIRDTNVANRPASSSGSLNYTGAVLVKRGSTFNMSGGVIEDNKSSAPSTQTVSGGTIYTSPSISGGGICANGGTVNISEDAVLRNNQSVLGGAIYMNGGSAVNVSGGLFEGNKADRLGGAIITASTSEKLTISAGKFDGNYSGKDGGALWVYGEYTTITGGHFVNNTAGGEGGAIGLADDTSSYLHLTNAIIRNNTASYLGGGIWLCPAGSAQFEAKEGVAIYDNTAGSAGDDIVTVPLSRGGGINNRVFNIYLSETVLAGERAAFYEDGALKQNVIGVFGTVDESVARFDPENPGEKLQIYGDVRKGLAIKTIISDDAKARYIEMGKDAEKGGVVLFENNSARLGGAIGGNCNVINSETKREPEDAELIVSKLWDEELQEEEIPEEITVKLLLDGNIIDSLILKKEEEWQGRFKGLIKDYLDEGRYTVEEVETEGFTAIYSDAVKDEDQENVWYISLKNYKVKEEYEPPEEPKDEGEVKDEYEEKKEEVKAETEEETKVKGAHTGDDTDLTMLTALMIISAMSSLAMYIRRRRADR